MATTGQFTDYRNREITVEIKTVFDFNKALAIGPYAWPGGYPLYFITADGGVLSWQAAIDEQALIRDSIIENPIEDSLCGDSLVCDNGDGWRIILMEINYEDDNLYCDHTGNKIESAYGDE